MSQSPEEFSAAIVSLQKSLSQMKKERDSLWHVLNSVLERIEDLDLWWFDVPDRGGFDVEKIRAVLTMKGLNDVS